jgi:uncharacterized protein with PIN domain
VAPTRFITDSSLAFVARRLRLLGFDVALLPGARLEEVLEAARREGREVLTTSTRHPRRYGDVVTRSVPRDAEPALRAIVADSEPSGAPFSRCSVCNTALVRRFPFEARGEVPSSVLRAGGPLRYCPSCGKWYWTGSHVARLREWLERTLDRPLAEDSSATPPEQPQ